MPVVKSLLESAPRTQMNRRIPTMKHNVLSKILALVLVCFTGNGAFIYELG